MKNALVNFGLSKDGNNPVNINFDNVCNIAVFGNIEKGKSTVVEHIINSLKTITQVEIIKLDTKFKGKEQSEVINEVYDILMFRKENLVKEGYRDIYEYNEKNPENQLPLIVFHIDVFEGVEELQGNSLEDYESDIQKKFHRILTGRAMGIMVIIESICMMITNQMISVNIVNRIYMAQKNSHLNPHLYPEVEQLEKYEYRHTNVYCEGSIICKKLVINNKKD